MIFTNKGVSNMQGAVTEILSDFSVIVEALNDCLTKDLGKEMAHKLLAEAFKLGLMSEEEIKAKHKEVLEKSLKDLLLKGLV